MSDVIATVGLTKIYHAGVDVPAVRGVDLRIAAASFVAIMGPSGSGKSTLLSLIGGLEPPTSGQVLLDGVDLGGLDDDRRAELRLARIGFVFQQYNLLPIFTALENVALPLRLAGIDEVEAARRAEEALAVVEMSSRRDQIPSHLSGGEQQRVAIARAVVGRPAIVLADEPTGALDTKNGELVIDVLRRLVDERGQTVVMVTHDAAVAARADRVITLRDGQVASDLEPRRSAPVAAGAEGPRE